MQFQDDQTNPLVLHCTLDLSGIVLAINPSGCDALGYSVNTLLQSSVFALFHPDDQPELQTAFAGFIQDLTIPMRQRLRLLQADGGFRSVDVVAQIMQGLAAPVVLLSCTGETTSTPDADASPIEAALHASTANLNAVLNNAIAAIFTFRIYSNHNLEHTNLSSELIYGSEYEYLSPHTQIIYGYSPDEFMADRHLWRSRVVPEDWQAIVAPAFSHISDGQSIHIIYRFRHKDDTIRWICEHSTARRDRTLNCWIFTAVALDVTDLNQARENLRQSEEKFRAIFEHTAIGIGLTDTTGRLIESNPSWQTMLGYTAEELLHLTFYDYTHPDDLESDATHFAELVTGKRNSYQIEKRYIRKDGQQFWGRLTVAITQATAEQSRFCFGMVEDITQRKQAEEQLKKREAQTRAILTAIPDTISLLKTDGTYIEINRSNTVGDLIPPHLDPIGKNLFELLPPEHAAREFQAIQAASLTGDIQIIEQQIEVNGQIQHEELRFIACDADTVVAILRDVGDRKQAEIEIQLLNTRLQYLLAVTPAVLFTCEPTDILQTTFISENVRTVLGYEPQQFLNEPRFWIDNVHPDDLGQMLDKELVEDTVYSYEYRFLHADGHYCWLYEQVKLARNVATGELEIVGYVVDICDRKRAETESQSLNARLQHLLTATPAILFTCRPEDYQTTFISENVRDILGYEPQTFTDNAGFWLNHVHPDDLESILTTERAEDTLYTYEYRFPHADGHYCWLYEQLKLFRNPTSNQVETVGYVIDISDRKRIDLEVRSLNARLQHLLTATPAIIFSCRVDQDHGTTFISENVRSILGYAPEAIIQDSTFWINHIHPDDVEGLLSKASQLFETPVHTHEYRFLHADGHYCWLYEQLSLIRNESGEPEEVVGYRIDISDIKQSEAALRQSEARFRTIFEGAAIGITVSRPPDHKLTQSNPAFRRMVGYSADELASHDHTLFTHPDDWGAEQQLIAQVIEEKRETYTIEKRYIRKDGEVIWVNMIASLVWGVDQLDMAVCLVENIDDRKQSEAALRDSEARFRRVFVDAPMGMAVSTLTGEIFQVNPALCEMLGYSELELQNLTFCQFLYEADRENHRLLNQQLFNRDIPRYTAEMRFLKPTGELVWVNVTAVLFEEIHNRTLYKLAMFENITERRTVEQMRDNFISVVSHELRTPITSIRGSLGLLATGYVGQLTPEGQEVLSIAMSETNRLTRLVNDILDLERLKSGHISFVKTLCQTSDLVAHSVDSMRLFASESGIQIIASAISATVWADGDRIIQTLTNLLNNAIKFSPPNSEIFVSVSRINELEVVTIPSPPSSIVLPAILFEVSDRGKGIPANKLAIIFEPFEQVDDANSYIKGGTGLGLAICQNIVQNHGGQIWATSTLGQGSSFFFTLPC